MSVQKTNKALMQRSVLRMLVSTIEEDAALLEHFTFLEDMVPTELELKMDAMEWGVRRRAEKIDWLKAVVSG